MILKIFKLCLRISIGINLLSYFFNKHFWKELENSQCMAALNLIFEDEISMFHCLINDIMLIFELLNFVYDRDHGSGSDFGQILVNLKVKFLYLSN